MGFGVQCNEASRDADKPPCDAWVVESKGGRWEERVESAFYLAFPSENGKLGRDCTSAPNLTSTIFTVDIRPPKPAASDCIILLDRLLIVLALNPGTPSRQNHEVVGGDSKNAERAASNDQNGIGEFGNAAR